MFSMSCSGCGRHISNQILACPDYGTPINDSKDTAVDPGQVQPTRESIAGAIRKNNEGVRLLEAGDYEGAAAVFSEAIALRPDDANYYKNRASAFRRLGRVELAQSDAEMAGTLQSSRVISQTPTQNQAIERDVKENRVGSGRYILSFFLAGFIGLGIQYALRDKGWFAVGINAVLFAIVLALLRR